MKDRRDYEEAFRLAGNVIRKWDPYNLIRQGAPENEFDGEIAKVVAAATRSHTPLELAQSMSQIFTDSLGEKFTPDDCLYPASKIMARLRESKLIAAA